MTSAITQIVEMPGMRSCLDERHPLISERQVTANLP